MTHKAIIFIGRSGSGKGTQAKLLMNDTSMYLGTGNHFREIMNQTDYTAQKIKTIYEEGGRHPDFLLITMLGNIFRFDYKMGQDVILDGGVRSLNEGQTILEILKFYEFTNIKVIHLNVSEEWSMDKLKNRGRDDDNEEVFKVKNEWFEREVKPAIEFMKSNPHVTFVDIDGERSIEEIHADIVSKI